MSTHTDRLDFLDLLKALASQLIVLHHLAFYGPMADHARSLAPGLHDFLAGPARIAVQVFLVVGGFLAARSLCARGLPGRIDPLGVVARRFLLLVPPFMAGIGLAVAANAVAGLWMTHDSLSAPPVPLQLAAHALLLHDLLGFEALSAGAWYVAIDFQLYTLLALLTWLAGRLPAGGGWIVPALVTAGVAASLLHFNRDPGWEAWALYFFGSYGMGALAWWASDPSRRPTAMAALLAAILLPALLALSLDFRVRIHVALSVALALVALRRGLLPAPGARAAPVRWLGRISYAVFLVHFPVCLLVNAFFTRFVSTEPVAQALGVLAAWAASVAAGALFHHRVETPLRRLASPGAGGTRLPARG